MSNSVLHRQRLHGGTAEIPRHVNCGTICARLDADTYYLIHFGAVRVLPDEKSALSSGEMPEFSGAESDSPEWFRPPSLTRERVVRIAATESALDLNPSKSVRELICEQQATDPQTQFLVSSARRRRREGKSATWRVDENNVLFYRDQFYVPAEGALRQELISLHHSTPESGHFGAKKTLDLLQRKYYWERISQDVRDFCSECHTCQIGKSPRQRPSGELVSLPIPQGPWKEVSMDFIVGLPAVEGRDGVERDAILVIVDRFTKKCRFFAVSSTMKSQELAELFHQEIELEYGTPDGIVSDRGSVFTSQFWDDLCYLQRVHRRLSTAFHPQTDGQTERMNQTLVQYLRCFVHDNGRTWPALLPEAQAAVNNSINATTHFSPNYALFGYQPEFNRRLEGEPRGRGGQPLHPNAEERIVRLAEIREQLKKNWAVALATHKRYYDEKHRPEQFRAGDLVLLSTKNLRMKGSHKFVPPFVGPFRVLEEVGSQAYRLALPNKYSRLHNVFPVVLLKRWKGDAPGTECMPMADLEDEGEWEVEEVREERRFEGETSFLVKWKGWPAEFNQWVSEEDMANAKDLIRKFRASQQRSEIPKEAKPQQNPATQASRRCSRDPEEKLIHR
ncbi:hypothetical protein VTJ04DRAFT_2114 [Mycothermus thermophilus]|uniref:uncharacterized protein n=1 Tax=Humicola insolens TaxID=85995 RepID=UPI003744AAC3